MEFFLGFGKKWLRVRAALVALIWPSFSYCQGFAKASFKLPEHVNNFGTPPDRI
jgi:hypothetical protein